MKDMKVRIVNMRINGYINITKIHHYSGKVIKVFMCGDYEFKTRSTHAYGISGASGMSLTQWSSRVVEEEQRS